jgi:hypothetical protein
MLERLAQHTPASLVEDCATSDELVRRATFWASADDKRTLAIEIEQLLVGDMSDEALNALWHQMPTGIVFRTQGGTRSFLSLVRALCAS